MAGAEGQRLLAHQVQNEDQPAARGHRFQFVLAVVVEDGHVEIAAAVQRRVEALLLSSQKHLQIVRRKERDHKS